MTQVIENNIPKHWKERFFNQPMVAIQDNYEDGISFYAWTADFPIYLSNTTVCIWRISPKR